MESKRIRKPHLDPRLSPEARAAIIQTAVDTIPDALVVLWKEQEPTNQPAPLYYSDPRFQ